MQLRNFVIAAVLSAVLGTSPVSAAIPAPGLGTLTLYAPDAPGHIQPAACTAVLITADTAITQASCFDKVRHLLNGDKHAVEGLFKLNQNGVTLSAAMLDLDIHRDYPWVHCDMPEWADACSQARQFCSRRFNAAPMQRNACLFDSAFYARTFAEGSTVDLALVYLNRRIDAATAPIADPFEEWPEQQQRFTVTPKDGGLASAQAQRVLKDAISTAYEPGLRTASGVWLEDAAGSLGLAALPSRFENLPIDPETPVNYLLTRIDSARTWIDISMNQACLQKRRLACTLPTALPSSPPQHLPVPAPTPEPNPQPSPSPPKHFPVPLEALKLPPPAAPPEPPRSPLQAPVEASPQPPHQAPPSRPVPPDGHVHPQPHANAPPVSDGSDVDEAPPQPDESPTDATGPAEVSLPISRSHKAVQRAFNCSQTGPTPWAATLWVGALRGLRRWRLGLFSRRPN